MKNKLNDLDPKTWLKFQKSWFIHNPPPRKKDVLVHPAKFPETMAQEFIEFFTKHGENVLDRWPAPARRWWRRCGPDGTPTGSS